jgi:hypothetical protein
VAIKDSFEYPRRCGLLNSSDYVVEFEKSASALSRPTTAESTTTSIRCSFVVHGEPPVLRLELEVDDTEFCPGSLGIESWR